MLFRSPLGSDELGRDVLSRLIMSIRLSLLIAFFGTLLAAAFGTAMGFVAAHFRGRVEALILMLIAFAVLGIAGKRGSAGDMRTAATLRRVALNSLILAALLGVTLPL